MTGVLENKGKEKELKTKRKYDCKFSAEWFEVQRERFW